MGEPGRSGSADTEAGRLNEAEREAYEFLRDSWDATGVWPTQRELAARFGYSLGWANRLVKSLGEKGWVQKQPRVPRSFVLTHEAPAPTASPEGVRLGPWLLSPQEATALGKKLVRLGGKP